jgi:hypothetical protein
VGREQPLRALREKSANWLQLDFSMNSVFSVATQKKLELLSHVVAAGTELGWNFGTFMMRREFDGFWDTTC